jgi:hypothetical protein
MSRTPITADGTSLVDDSGTVLWSLIRGEQLEFPIKIAFLGSCVSTSGYVFEACVLEAENAPNQENAPDAIQQGGVKTDLNVANGGVRLLVDVGVWSAAAPYNAGEMVSRNGKYYALKAGAARVNSTVPESDSYWEETTPNTIYIRFPGTLGADWSVKPKIGFACYGFFELSVQEPAAYSWRRKWKPTRGMVELLYSPTQTPADV